MIELLIIFCIKTSMVVSLYVCDIPQNIEKEELESVFSCFDGFVEVRLAKDKNRYGGLVLNDRF